MCARSDGGTSTFSCVSSAHIRWTNLASDVVQMLHSTCPRTVPYGSPVYIKQRFLSRCVPQRFGHAWSTSANEATYSVERQTSQVTVWSKVSIAADRSSDTKNTPGPSFLKSCNFARNYAVYRSQLTANSQCSLWPVS